MATDKKSPENKEVQDKAPAKAKTKKPASEKVKAEGAESTKKTAKAPKSATPASKRGPLTPKTFFAKTAEIPSGWRLIDATGVPLGRLSTYIAQALMGKDKASYTRSVDTGDHIVVINATKVRLTGKKWEDKVYHHHTGYPGGIKSITARELLEKNPERLITKSVYGMLPKGHMGRHWFKKLRVFAGADHPHTAQQPQPVKLPNLGVWENA